jgi:uncharacterized protein YjbI with pentapeptide repeats
MEEKQGRRSPRIPTLWSWLQFPVLAMLLGAGIIWLNIQQSHLALQLSQQQHTTALQIAHDQQQEALLMNYMDTISDLLVHEKLLTARPANPPDLVVVVAETRTQEVLKQLDPDRKATLMRFLFATKLINNDHRIISMLDADVHNAHLRATDLRDTFLVGANLSGADLRGANLSYATLSYVNLSGANLAGADLHGSDLHNVDLARADLTGANLKDAFDLGDTLFTQARSLSGATMPDGTVHP